MDILDFKETNSVFGEDQPEYLPLPAHRVQDPTGTVITCWGLSWRERLKVLFTGRIWVSLLTFGHPIQPQLLSETKPAMYKEGGE